MSDDEHPLFTRREFLAGTTIVASDLALQTPEVKAAETEQVSEVKAPVDPILLLPLRLEYRYIPPDALSVRAETDAASKGDDDQSARGRSPLSFKSARSSQPELWFRWYPDDPLYSSKPAPPSDDEKAALKKFTTILDQESPKCWYDMKNASINAAWQEFAGAVGFSRALHLKRVQDGTVTDGPGSRLLGLPDHICLYGIIQGKIVKLTPCDNSTIRIPRELSYSGDCLAVGEWLSDFAKAKAQGMGICLSNTDAINKALTADWIIAVGFRDEDAQGDLEKFLANVIANGEIDFLPQDAPTNSSPRQSSAYRPWISDPVAALPSATYFERRRDKCLTNTDDSTDADAVARALGIDANVLHRIRNAEQRERDVATAMAGALMPLLTHFFDGLLTARGIEAGAFARFLATNAYARGPLPALRLDHSPYGILPICTPDDLNPPSTASPSDKRVFGFVKDFCEQTINELQEFADAAPVLRPGATANQGEVLRRVLQILPVSSRVDASNGPQDPRARRVICPLVSTNSPYAQPIEYCKTVLQFNPQLPPFDPSDRNTAWPLLYRLLLVARSLLEQDRDRIPAFEKAVRTVAGLPRPELEVLLLEVLDLLDHRVDAWQTSLASYRLTAHREARRSGLKIGWYGMLGKLRTNAAPPDSDGYIVAPSVAQATTVGLLRSAALRLASENRPFQINLCSRRVRKALITVNAIRKGIPLNEVLGYHAERSLHDRGQDVLIYDLRALYPIRRGSEAEATTYPLIDGERFLKDGNGAKGHFKDSKQKDEISRLLEELSDERDAFCDLVVAESVHQLALGNTSKVSAWMQVLSGGMPPGEVDFVNVHRGGQRSSFRVLFVDSVSGSQGESPRALAEPLLARLAKKITPSFDTLSIRCSLAATDSSGSNVRGTVDLSSKILNEDMGLEPIDLLLGGKQNLDLVCRAYLVNHWNTVPVKPDGAKLKPLPARDLQGFLNQDCAFQIDEGQSKADSASLADLWTRLDVLRKIASKARALTLADLHPSADSAATGTPGESLATQLKAISALRERAKQVQTAIEAATSAVNGKTKAVLTDLQTGSSLSKLQADKSSLDSELRRLQRFGVTDALWLWTAEEVMDKPEAFKSYLAGSQAGLTSRLDDLQKTISEPDPKDSLGAGALIHELVGSLQAVCGGDGVPIWPPVHVTISAGEPLTLEAAFDRWPDVRETIQGALQLMKHLPDYEARRWQHTDGDATSANPPISDVSIHLTPRTPTPTGPLCGFAVDEWSIFQPSSLHTAGVALNHDAPQAQAPHCLLLGVAANDDQAKWDEEKLVRIVSEAIRLMRVRALSSMEGSITRFGLRALNLVPQAEGKGKAYRRVPLDSSVKHIPWNKELFGWKPKLRRPNGQSAHALVERNLFGEKR